MKKRSIYAAGIGAIISISLLASTAFADGSGLEQFKNPNQDIHNQNRLTSRFLGCTQQIAPYLNSYLSTMPSSTLNSIALNPSLLISNNSSVSAINQIISCMNPKPKTSSTSISPNPSTFKTFGYKKLDLL